MKTLFLFVFIFLFSAVNAQYFAWAKRAGLWAFDLGYGVGTDNAGNVYISGKYEMNKASFGTTTVGCAGNHDIYTAKYGPSGNFLWVKTAGGPGGDYSHCMAVDGAGNSYVAGEIEQTVNFGGGVTLTSNGDNDVFIAKYNTNGGLVWAKKMGGSNKSDKALGICISGNMLYLTGKFEGTANFAGTTLSASGGYEIFVAKYSTDGVFQWVKKAGGSGNDEGYAVSADISGNCYVTGYFSGNASFSGVPLSSNGAQDIFIAKYNSSGTILWAKKAGGTAADYGHGIKVDNSSRVFVTGGFRLKSTFGSYTMTAQKGDADIFVARYDANGNVVWVKKAGGSINDYGRAIATDANSNVYITGNYGQKATFGTYTLTGTDLTEIYFASYDLNGNFRWALKAGGAYDKSDPDRFIEMGLSIATDPSGNVIGSGAYRSSSTFGSTTLAPWDHTEVYVTKIIQGQAKNAMLRPMINAGDSVSFCSGGSVTLKTKQDTVSDYVWMRNGTIIEGANEATYKANIPGDYCVMALYGGDTIVSGKTKVIMTQKIRAEFASTATVICKDSNTVLKAVESEGNIYRWSWNGRQIKGVTSSTYQPLESGDYQVKIIQGSCFEWSPVMHVEVKKCADTKALFTNKSFDDKDSSEIRIYPNPNNGLFTLELNMAQAPKQLHEVKVEVINAIGQVIYSKAVSLNDHYLSHHVELENGVMPGIYFLHIIMGDKEEKTRLMLVR
jgi:hypothetical protein